MEQPTHSIRLELAAEDIGERTGGRSTPASPVAARLAAAARAGRAAPSAQRLAERLLAAERRRKVSQRRNSPTEHTTLSLRRKEKKKRKRAVALWSKGREKPSPLCAAYTARLPPDLRTQPHTCHMRRRATRWATGRSEERAACVAHVVGSRDVPSHPDAISNPTPPTRVLAWHPRAVCGVNAPNGASVFRDGRQGCSDGAAMARAWPRVDFGERAGALPGINAGCACPGASLFSPR